MAIPPISASLNSNSKPPLLPIFSKTAKLPQYFGSYTISFNTAMEYVLFALTAIRSFGVTHFRTAGEENEHTSDKQEKNITTAALALILFPVFTSPL